MAEKLVSVYINAYNEERFIEATLKSVAEQTYKNLEIIVIDDCSTDRTNEIVKSFGDSRIKLYKNDENMHMSYSCNRGAALASGDYIAHVDADDTWAPDFVEKQVAFLEEHSEYGACFSHSSIIDENGNPANDRYPADKHVYELANMPQRAMFRYLIDNSNHLSHSAYIARAEVVKKLKKYDHSLRYLQDYEHWLHLLLICPIYIFSEPLSFVRKHSSNGSELNAEQRIAHDTEFVRTIKNAIAACPDDYFLEAFEDRLKLKGPHTHEEVELEKAFFLTDGVYYLKTNPVLATERLAELFRDEEYIKLASKKFGFTINDFYKLETTRCYHDESKSDELKNSRDAALNETAACKEQIENLRLAAQRSETHIENLNGIIKSQENQLAENARLLEERMAVINQLNTELMNINNNLIEIRNSFFWRSTAPFRKVSQRIKDTVSKNRKLLNACIIGKCLLRNGFGAARLKYSQLCISTEMFSPKSNDISAKRRKQEEEHKFKKDIKFSILVPLYNTPKVFLEEMIDSVTAQTYKNWELCLADGSDKEHSYVGNICKKLAHSDSRIKYKRLERNGGISENTNACIEMSTGDYIALFDHDDILHPSALYKYMLEICDKNADFIYCDEDKFEKLNAGFYDQYFKPDFAPDMLCSNNYICHFTVFKKSLLEKTGGFRSEFDGSQDHDIILRLTEQAESIVHVPEILYHWRVSSASVASDPYAKPYTIEAGKKAVAEHLERLGLKGTVESTVMHPNIYRIKYEIKDNPLVSIIIPSYNHVEDLSRCINSIIEKSTYKNYEIIIVENNSDEKTFEYYETLKKYPQIKVVVYKPEGGFNYSAINNFGVQFASGEHYILLNNDVEIISPDWIEEMLMYSQREDVGAVGAKLYYPDNTIQHAGISIGVLTLAGHNFKHFPRENNGYFGRAGFQQNVSAVTFACVMMRKAVFDAVNGLDESFEVAFNDVDMCMRIRKAGYLICWTPFAELYHYESISRGTDEAPEKRKRFLSEVSRFQSRWKKELAAGDPYYNKNLTLLREDFSMKTPEEFNQD